MPVGPRLALSEFSVFTYTKLENSDLQNSDFSKTAQKSPSRDVNWTGRNLLLGVYDNNSKKLCSIWILHTVWDQQVRD